MCPSVCVQTVVMRYEMAVELCTKGFTKFPIETFGSKNKNFIILISSTFDNVLEDCLEST